MDTKPTFEKFRRYKVTGGDTPMVSLHRRGVFALNASAYEALGEPEAVQLLYAPEKRIIGFQAATRSSPDAYKVRRPTKSAFHVDGRGFGKYYDIPEEATGQRYNAEMLDNILTVNLNRLSSQTP